MKNCVSRSIQCSERLKNNKILLEKILSKNRFLYPLLTVKLALCIMILCALRGIKE